MTNLFHDFTQYLQNLCKDLYQIEDQDVLSKMYFERSPSHVKADMSTSVALSLAKYRKNPPMDIAQEVADSLLSHENIKEAHVLKPGFVNITLQDTVLDHVQHDILQVKEQYGFKPVLKGQTYHIEYISANPTGPLHIGHVRGAVLGECLAILTEKMGAHVIREYYLNDAGGQVDVLAMSMICYLDYLKTHDEKSLETASYKSDTMLNLAKELEQDLKHQNLSDSETKDVIKKWIMERFIQMIKDDLEPLKIYQKFVSESWVVKSGMLKKAYDVLHQGGYLYEGELPKPKGEDMYDWEPRKQLLFKSTLFGDDMDRAMQKSNGDWTYFSGDVAYHYTKLQQNPDVMIVILGADHFGYIKRLTAVVDAMSGKKITKGQIKFIVKISQFVRLLKNGKIVRMSKRAGNVVTLKQLNESVGRDAIYFMMMMRKSDAMLDFDLDKAIEYSKDNPLFYVQYASARCYSILRMAKKTFEDSIEQEYMQDTSDSHTYATMERDILITLAYWPELLSKMLKQLDVHMTTYYLIDLAGKFHSLWNEGKSSDYLRFVIPDNKQLTLQRLRLVMGVYYVIRAGLSILSIDSVNELH